MSAPADGWTIHEEESCVVWAELSLAGVQLCRTERWDYSTPATAPRPWPMAAWSPRISSAFRSTARANERRRRIRRRCRGRPGRRPHLVVVRRFLGLAATPSLVKATASADSTLVVEPRLEVGMVVKILLTAALVAGQIAGFVVLCRDRRAS
jgi:hypothetical protein